MSKSCEDRCVRTHMHAYTYTHAHKEASTQCHYFQSVHFPFQEEKWANDKDFTSNSRTHTSCNITDGDEWHISISTTYPSISVFRHYLLVQWPHTALCMYVPSRTEQSGSIKPINLCSMATLNTDRASSWHTPHQSLLANQYSIITQKTWICNTFCEETKYCTYWKIWQQTDSFIH
jgi:hypothetical protein